MIQQWHSELTSLFLCFRALFMGINSVCVDSLTNFKDDCFESKQFFCSCLKSVAGG